MIVAELATPNRLFALDSDITVIEAAFLRDEELVTVLIGELHHPATIRIVERARFLMFVAGRSGGGGASYSRRTMADFASPPALVVERTMTVADAAALAIGRGHDRWADPVAVRDADGLSVVTAANLFRHVTDELAEQVELDHLTGVFNRRGFLQRLRAAADEQQPGQRPRTLLLVDLDGFKLVNDALGHHVGDELLRSTAQRLSRAVPGAVVARMGGDEFAVLTSADEVMTPEEVAWAIVQRVGLPSSVAGTEVTVLASVGAAVVVAGHATEDLMHRADIALYRAKDAGKNCYCVFDDRIHRDVVRQLMLSRELREAIRRDEFELHYQPVVDLDSGTVVAHEALARWCSPSSGPINPTSSSHSRNVLGSSSRSAEHCSRKHCAHRASTQEPPSGTSTSTCRDVSFTSQTSFASSAISSPRQAWSRSG